MISGTQTLFNWSLRADTRSIYPHIIRAIFAGFMLLAILAAWADSVGSMAPGLYFFEWLCRLNVLIISVSGISYFVSAVTEEKDSGTLALLRLAGVSPLAIILSKSTSRLVSALMLLMTQIPFTFLAITLGGVTWQQIIAAYLGLAAWMCLVANVALFCSVRCRTSGRAASLATSILLLFFAAGPLLQAVAGLKGIPWISPRVAEAFLEIQTQQQLTSIFPRLDQIFASNANLTMLAEQFWRGISVGLVMFFVSVALFNRYSEPAEHNPHGSSVRVRRFTVGRCWKLPVVWKDFLFFMGGKSFMLVKSLGYVALVGGFIWFHNLEQPNSSQWLSSDLTRKAFLTVTLLLSVELLLYSSSSLFLEIRESAIASLRMLPIHTPVILLQKVAASFLATSPAILTLALLWLYNPRAFTNFDDFPEMVVTWLFAICMSTHLCVLLSLYTRWAALPLAILVTVVSFPCIGGAAMGLFTITETAAALNGISIGIWMGVVVNFVWMWLFVLLPIEIEIVNRWNRLSRE